MLASFCKVNLSNAKKFGLICFPRNCFLGRLDARENELRERIPVPHDNFFKSI